MISKILSKRSIKLLLLVLCVCSFNSMRAQTYTASLSGPAKVGEGSKFTLSLDLENTIPMIAYQARIIFPEGFEPVANPYEDDEEWWSTDRATRKHLLSGRWHADTHELVLVCYSSPWTAFKETEGAICRIYVKANSGLQTGNYTFTISQFILDTDGETVVPVETRPYVVEYDPLVTGIVEVEAEAEAAETDGYNVMGQRVNDSYHGIIVKKGEKTLNID